MKAKQYVGQFKFAKLVHTPARDTKGQIVSHDVRVSDELGAPLHSLGSVYNNDYPFDNHQKITLSEAGRYATLFASAPELLEALKAFINVCDNGNPMELVNEIGALIEPARQAIAKAEGA
jgi:hypothetical protein